MLGWPLTEYQRYQLVGYQESTAAGDVICIADQSARPELAVLDRDFWLFDINGPQPFAALMAYDDADRYTGSEITAVPEAIERCKAAWQLAERYSVPLDTYLARLRSAAA
jgi:hypothetical protein